MWQRCYHYVLVCVQWPFSVLCAGCNYKHLKKKIPCFVCIWLLHMTEERKTSGIVCARYKYRDNPNGVLSYCCVILGYSLWSGKYEQRSFWKNTVQQDECKWKGTLMSCLTVSLVLMVTFLFYLQVTSFTVNAPKCGKEQRPRAPLPADEVQYCNPSLLFKFLFFCCLFLFHCTD